MHLSYLIIQMIRNLFRTFRCFCWRFLLNLKNVHPTFLAGGYSQISPDFSADAYSYVGPGCIIGPMVSVGAYSMLGPGVRIIGNDHIFDIPGRATVFSGRPTQRETIIGKDVWIGAGCSIICGVKIGHGSIVGVGSVVTKDIPPLVVMGGVPAKFIRRRFADFEKDHIHLKYLSQEPYGMDYPKNLG